MIDEHTLESWDRFEHHLLGEGIPYRHGVPPSPHKAQLTPGEKPGYWNFAEDAQQNLTVTWVKTDHKKTP